MGWKNVRDYFNVPATLKVRVSCDGMLELVEVTRYRADGYGLPVMLIPTNRGAPPGLIFSQRIHSDSLAAEVSALQDRIRKEQDKLEYLMAAPDTFENLVEVFSVTGSSIQVDHCEVFEAGEQLCSGLMINPRVHGRTPAEAIKAACRTLAGLRLSTVSVVEQWFMEVSAGVTSLKAAAGTVALDPEVAQCLEVLESLEQNVAKLQASTVMGVVDLMKLSIEGLREQPTDVRKTTL